LAARKKADEVTDEPIAEVTELPVVIQSNILDNKIEVVASRAFKVNMGNYESADSFVSAKINVNLAASLEDVAATLGEIIDTLQEPDLTLFKSLTKESKSIAHRLV
jgi:hypothetical protein